MMLSVAGRSMYRVVVFQVVALVCLTGPACDASTRPAAQQHAPSTQPEASGPGEESAQAERDGEYFECRALPELGQIIFSDNPVRGPTRVKYLKQHKSELAKKGIYACADESKREVHHETHKIGGRTIESAVVIEPPTHKGDNGDVFTGRLLVNVDGHRKIDCTLGTTADGELWVSKVVIHVDDASVEIYALDGDGDAVSIPPSPRIPR